MEFLPTEIAEYAASKTSPETEVLANLNRDTYLKTLYPRMLSGHMQGRVLSFLTTMMRPRRVLEIGTFTGYSCICMAEGLADDGKVVSIEMNAEMEDFIIPALEESGVRDKVELHFGYAADIIPTLTDTFDLVFIDADKQNYLPYYHMVLPKVRKGGVILADNVLWSGKVLGDAVNDKETKGIQAFNDYVNTDPSVEQVLLPIRDGIMMIRKH